MNSKFKSSVVNADMRYIIWVWRNKNGPANLDETDFDDILKSDKLFARKFEYPVSDTLLKKLMAHFNKA